jgi:uncharacterized protein (DUF111 family)
MFLAALLDAGLSRRALAEDLAALPVDHRLVVSRVQRGPIAARYLRVVVPKAHRHGSSDKGNRHGHGRSWREIRRLLRDAKLRRPVRERAERIFASLAEAEGRVHGLPSERVHFHEVGAVDAIVDIVGAAAALDRLGVSRVTASPPALGHGTVESEHGTLPLPAPATLELLRGIPVVPAHVAWETVTPTGAAILRDVVDAFCPLPAFSNGTSWVLSPEKPRATTVAPNDSASITGSMGVCWLASPFLLFDPTSADAENWPLVRPYTPLFSMM